MWEICLLVFVAVFVTILSVIFLVHSSVCCISKSPIRFSTAYAQRSVLVVTAHPDDECMFFAPTILMLQQLIDAEIHLLCLSSGKTALLYWKYTEPVKYTSNLYPDYQCLKIWFHHSECILILVAKVLWKFVVYMAKRNPWQDQVL